jgi:nicotinate dehydrogenase subunit B
MTDVTTKTFSRRTFVKGGGSLVVGFSLAGTIASAAGAASAASTAAGPGYWAIPALDQVDSFLQIASDGTVLAKFGKGTAAQGTTTGVLQMYAEELDVSLDKIKMVIGDTALTPNQTGASGSNGISTEWTTVRQAAATARQKLLGLASAKLGAPVSSLSVNDGVVSAAGSSQTVSYGELIGGQTFNLTISATAPQKEVSQFKVIGTSQQRREIPLVATGTYHYVGDVRLPGMLHARNVRPPIAGSTLVSVDGPHDLPGLVKVVAKGNYLAVVTKTEWQAIQASHALRVTWKPPATPAFPDGYDELYSYMASATPSNTSVNVSQGNAAAALASAARQVSATYQIDFQSHATLGPFCAVADYSNGSCVVYTGGQKPYWQQTAVADMLSKLVDPAVTPNNVRVIWYPGASSYGRSEADDVSQEAAFLSAMVGAPVRMQWTRQESTAWDPKGPAGLITVQGGLDANNKVVAYDWASRSISGSQIPAEVKQLGDSLLGNLLGYAPSFSAEYMFPANSYGFPNDLRTGYIVPWDQALGTGLRSSHLRDPGGPQTTFASEQFIDELAYAAGLDPIAFRLTYLTDPRDIRIVQQVAKASGWASRPSPGPGSSSSATVVTGRGVAYQQRSGTIDAHVAVVEVNRKTGKIKVTKLTTAQDSGYVVNPAQVTYAIKAGNMHGISRATTEAVTFDANSVTSTDWVSYPITEIQDAPEMNVVLVGADGIDPSGAFTKPSGSGEPMQRPLPAAIANAVFDATGVRVRRMPMTPDVVLAALKAAGKAL